MTIPVLVLGILIIWGMLSRKIFGTANHPVFLITALIVLLAMSSLRAPFVGADTQNYIDRFNSQLTLTFDEIRTEAASYKDPVYVLSAWAFGKVIPNAQVWLGFTTLVFLAGVALVLYWESPDYSFSLIYLYCMGIFFFSITGLRQAISMGILMISYYFLVKRQLIPFALLVFLASRFHGAAIVFIIAYPIAMLRAGWIRILIGIMVFIIVLLFRDTIGAWMIRAVPDALFDERLESYAARTVRLNASGFIIQASMLVFCLRYRTEVVREVPHREALYNLASIAIVFQACAMSIAEFFRVSNLFSWSYMLLIPICIQHETKRNKSYDLVRITVMAALIACFFYSTIHNSGIVPYSFFWEKGALQ